jgi:hypothetical protein
VPRIILGGSNQQLLAEEKRRQEKILGHNKHLSLSLKLEYDDRKKKHMML